ncbi:hypothetical protein [Halobacillus sp. Marseille-Q1614]|uniref:hypothetical protein n=1 Tax=Halobacillus sp. Marseille-Q1614 TaxID=2709134 RepID=UPI001570D7D6|nr:hypothetical protein [Halobacillus sp. Marseille-Q1614]
MKRRWLIIVAALLIISLGFNYYQYQSHEAELTDIKRNDVTAMRGLATELAVLIGDEDASDGEIRALAFSLNRMTSDLAQSQQYYPGGNADHDFYQKLARTLLSFVSQNDVTQMPIQTRDVIFQNIMSSLGTKDAEYLEQQLVQLKEQE